MIEMSNKISVSKNNKFGLKVARVTIPLCIALSVLAPNSALADSYTSLDTAITKVETLSSSLSGIVGGMLTLMVSTAGGSAVFQIFRRMILSNL